MGRYIDDILQPGEKVLYSTNAHWIFYLAGDRGLDRGHLVARSVAHDRHRRPVLLCLSTAAVGGDRTLYWTVRPGSTAGPPKPT